MRVEDMGEKDVSVQSVGTALSIVEALKELGDGGVTELASALDLPKSTVHNHLVTLERSEFLVKEGESYRLACRFLELGAVARDQKPIYRIAKPEVRKLAKETGELSGLITEEHGRGVFLCRAKGNQAVHVDTYQGKRIYLHTAALGKAVLAHLPDERVDEIIDRHGLPEMTSRTITDRDELMAELETIRERGIAFDDEERLRGLRSVAAPIRSENDTLLGAISVAGPTSRMQPERFEETIPDLIRNAVNVIELNVTYS